MLGGRVTFTVAQKRSVNSLPLWVRSRGDLKGGGLEEVGQEALGAGGGLLRQDLDIHPARGAVDGGEQVAALVLVGQLRQVLNVDMDKAGGIVLEGLVRRLAARVAGQEGLEVRDPMTAQATIQTGARDPRVEELAGHRQ